MEEERYRTSVGTVTGSRVIEIEVVLYIINTACLNGYFSDSKCYRI